VRVEDAIDRLYSLPLEDFTGERNELARELRAEGRREDAERVKALRKPSVSAWAVNRAVREEPGLLEALLGAGGELRQAHRQASRGGGAAQLREAAGAEREAVEALAGAARKAAGRRAGDALMDRVRATLHAASLDEPARDLVARGLVVDDLVAVGLGPFASDAGGARHARNRPPSGRTPPSGGRPGHPSGGGSDRAARKRLEREARSAETAVGNAETRVENAQEALAEAKASLASQKKRLKDARAELKKLG
jgi:hypothetical protein